jgi:EAL domain-containing protein (putative c-di-GMP-specific phosphodiesterase class I)
LVTLGRLLELKTVAEGIEEPEQLMMLREMGCELGQGFLFERPMTAPEMTALVGDGEALERLRRIASGKRVEGGLRAGRT